MHNMSEGTNEDSLVCEMLWRLTGIMRSLPKDHTLFHRFRQPIPVAEVRRFLMLEGVPAMNLSLLKQICIQLPPVGNDNRIDCRQWIGLHDDHVEPLAPKLRKNDCPPEHIWNHRNMVDLPTKVSDPTPPSLDSESETMIRYISAPSETNVAPRQVFHDYPEPNTAAMNLIRSLTYRACRQECDLTQILLLQDAKGAGTLPVSVFLKVMHDLKASPSDLKLLRSALCTSEGDVHDMVPWVSWVAAVGEALEGPG
eukprot:gnl/MRDRNA2_/MRDRNA2_78902_c0_seq2.p1 gnl/MRDRNA2_/MRDRNA2_78902_c0~~gnl/MRDRNA2_/MRDRNA2_78902_c0_seq2.p1  ORF type:complete len:254 (-),score=29.63 gnl/MRDRNA2_/MRDRNA2_78902_c0_seq2:5-766(-)